MDFNFKEEQQQFADALRRWMDKVTPSRRARRSSARRPACRTRWAAGRAGHDGVAGAGRAGRLQRRRRSTCWW